MSAELDDASLPTSAGSGEPSHGQKPELPEGQPQAPIVPRPWIYLVGALTVLILGLNWPIMSWGVEMIDPLWLTSIRLVGAGSAVAAVLAVTGRLRLPPRHDFPVVATVAVIRLALVYGLVMSALLLVPPGRSSVLAHTGALWAVPLGIWLLREHPSRLTLLGLATGLVGIVLLMEPWALEARSGAGLGYAMLIGAALATAVATVHVRGHRWSTTPLVLMPWQLLLAGLLTVPAALALSGPPPIPASAGAMAVIAYEVLLASGFGVWGMLALARSLPPVSSGMLFMAVPAVGVASSILLVGEVITPPVAIGIALIFAGVGVDILSGRLPGARAARSVLTRAGAGR